MSAVSRRKSWTAAKSLTQLASEATVFTHFRLTFARHVSRINPGCDLLCHHLTSPLLHSQLARRSAHPWKQGAQTVKEPACLSTTRRNATKPSTSQSAR